MTGGPTRSDTYAINVQVENVITGILIDHGVWDKMTGGEVDSDDAKYNEGGMQPPISLGGKKTVGNVTVSRLYRLARDHDVAQVYINGAGKASMVVTKQPLDIDGHTYGKPIVYKGTLKRVGLPEVDSESSNAGLIELEMTVEGFPTQ